MNNGKKVLIIGLTLLTGFTYSAGAVTKGMKKVVDEALDFSVKQSMSMFSEMQGQRRHTSENSERWQDDYLRISLVDKWFLSRFPCGTVTSIVMIRK